MAIIKRDLKKNKFPETKESQFFKQDDSYNQLLELCVKIGPEKDKNKLKAYSSDFANASDYLFQEIEQFKAKIFSVPFIAVVLVWAGQIEKDKVFGSRYLQMMQDLLLIEVIPYKSRANAFVTMDDFNSLNPLKIVNDIRCLEQWNEQKKEDYVSFFIEFINWLSNVTMGYVLKIQDPDRQLTIRRHLPYELYIKIISSLSLREKILAKMFYLGGSRSLDEVLSIKIEDIDYEECKLSLLNYSISYPRHVLEDLENYIGERKSGFVFIGRNGDKIDHTVPYRALKTVTTKLNLDRTFTFKDFVREL